MSSGRRYNEEPKLNKKKVVGVIIAFIVLIMCIVSIKKLLEAPNESGMKTETAYFAAYQNGKWGVINQTGMTVIPCTYEEMIIVPDSTKDIFIVVSDVDFENLTYHTKAFNKNQTELFTGYDLVEAIDNYDTAQNIWYEKNVLRVKKEGKYGLINMAGKEILACEYDEISSLKGSINSLILKKGDRVGLASNVGDVIVPATYHEVKPMGDDYSDGYIVVNEEGKQGVIGSNKKIILESIYDDISPVTENGYYVVKEEGAWKIINAEKETVLDHGFDQVMQIEEDHFIVSQDGKVGMIEAKGEFIIPFEYQELRSLGTGYYIAKKEDKYGIIGENNDTVVEFSYSYIRHRKDTDFIEAEQGATDTDIYNKNMEKKLTGIVSEVNVDKGYISIHSNGEQKYYNFKFEEKTAQDIFPNHTLFLSKKDGKFGYKNKAGDLIVDYIYDDAKEQNEYGFCSVKKGNVWGSINSEGNIAKTPSKNLDNYLIINFIGNWNLAEDLNLYYYEAE